MESEGKKQHLPLNITPHRSSGLYGEFYKCLIPHSGVSLYEVKTFITGMLENLQEELNGCIFGWKIQVK